MGGSKVHLARRPQAASEARAALAKLNANLDGALMADLRLLVSEVISTRVAASARGPAEWLELDIEIDDECVSVRLVDVGRHWVFEPAPHAFDPESSSGWGLYLIDRLADRWGVARDDPAVTIWFALSRD